jgi:hypothetical protein
MSESEKRLKENDDTIEFEKCFLGCLLIEAAQGDRIPSQLKEGDFYSKQHGQIFTAIYKLWDQKIQPDITVVCKEPDLKDIGADYISALTNIIPSAANWEYYENQIILAKEKRTLREKIKTANEMINGHEPTDTVVKYLTNIFSAVISKQNETTIKSAAELLSIDFPDMKWIIPGLIGEGLTMINGSPKIGKSWLALSLAIAAANSGAFLGGGSLGYTAIKTETLYMALEDTERRIHSRLKKLDAPPNDKLKIATQWRYGYIGLENYLKVNTNIGLVIIDTLACFANIKDFNAYTDTTDAIRRIKKIADSSGIAIVIIHHAKKDGASNTGADWMESALGSTGLTGSTDCNVFIKRTRSKEGTNNTAQLFATGRDTNDTQKFLKMDSDCHGWVVIAKNEYDELNKKEKNTAPERKTKKKENRIWEQG